MSPNAANEGGSGFFICLEVEVEVEVGSGEPEVEVVAFLQ